MPSVQDLIHRFEQGGSGRWPRLVFATLVIIILIVGYNWRAFRNLGTQEAMDSAQVGHNLALGRGFTTQFVRPFSIYLVKEHNARTETSDTDPDPARLEGMHPDLANPPVYPLVLAGLMKVLPFRHEVNLTDAFWSDPSPRPTEEAPQRIFKRSQPDFLISLFNQLLLAAIAIMTFFLARRLFDNGVAWLSFVLVLGCELLWRFSVSGLSTLLLMVVFMALIWCLVWIESEEREPVWSHRAQLWLALAIGLLLGLGTLTRYSFGWLAVPVLVYLGIFCAIRRTRVLLLAGGMFLLVLTPWIWRNLAVSGTPFGTAGYAILEGSFAFPKDTLARSLQPDFKGVGVNPFLYKFLGNTRQIIQEDLPRLGGSWVSALFLTGLLLGFRNPALQRLRYFLLAALLVLLITQALGRTQLTDESPVLNSENLLVLTTPLVLIFGAGLFFLLLDQMNLKLRELRYLIIGVFGIVMCLPFLFVFLSPKVAPLNYPPYYPPSVQMACNVMKPTELIMSDIPWAIAWYGDRQSVWLTRNAQDQFFAINDYLKPVRGLYLTTRTTDTPFLSNWVRAQAEDWEKLVFDSLWRSQMDPKFPLRRVMPDLQPGVEQLFLTDYPRWTTKPATNSSPPTAGEGK